MRVIGLIVLGVAWSAFGGLRIGEICPRPSALDVNGRESGWVELVNDGDSAVDLADYELVIRKRGKKRGAQGDAEVNLQSRVVASGARTLVYTSEMYDNAEDYGGDGETVKTYGHDLMVVPVKISPKKFPLVELYCGTNKSEKVLCDALAVPADISDGSSLAHGELGPVVLAHPTPGTANNLSGALVVGPEIGPLRGVKHDLSDHEPFSCATNGCDYAVSFFLNPPGDDFPALDEVRLIYRAGFGTVVTAAVACVRGDWDAQGGQRWHGTIPAAAIPAPGGLLRWAALVTDAEGRRFRAPAFRNPEDGPEWYGTIVAGHALDSATLQTFHLFADSSALSLMDKQYDSIASAHPLGARCGIYDAVTGLYYDNVRIDLRGQTTASFNKKSHGLLFSKVQPLSCVDPVSGMEFDGVRKTSFVAAYSDPSCLRQALSYYVMRSHGMPVPNDYPVRLNLNGAFYELAWNSNRFTNEYLEDIAELDPLGYAWKGCGTLTGGGEKTLPELGGSDASSVMSTFASSIAGVTAIGESGDAVELPAVTKTVVKSFDLPAWLNYLATVKITQECDDVWANICMYRDYNSSLPKRGGEAWTGTWRPLAYDNHLSWGAWFYGDDTGYGRNGLRTTDDRFKSHPFYGGMRVLCHKYNSSTVFNSGNRGYEAVWQSAKFRRLFLRRLRTLMDQTLLPPGTPREATPFWGYVTNLLAACSAEDALDHAKWGYGTGTQIWDWPTKMDMAQGVEDLWNNYIVPRRVHLYETHSITNTEKGVGYERHLSAGIPAAQSAFEQLKGQLTVERCDGGVVIRNGNDEEVDLSGWKLKGPVKLKLPPGTVIDRCIEGTPGEVFVVTNRLAYVNAHDHELVDQVIVGNAKVGDGRLTFTTATGEEVMREKVHPTLRVESRAGRDFQVAELSVTVEGLEDPMESPLVVSAWNAEGVLAARATVAAPTNGVYQVVLSGLDAGTVYTFKAELDGDEGVRTTPLAHRRTGWIDEDVETFLGESAAKWRYDEDTLTAKAGKIDMAVGEQAATAEFTPDAATGRVYSVTHRVTFDAPGEWSEEQEAVKPRAAFRVVADSQGVYRFALYGEGGWHVNADEVAQLGVEYELRVTFDVAAHGVAYVLVTAAGDVLLWRGAVANAEPVAVAKLQYRGNGSVRKIDGDVYDVNVATVNGVDYETVSNAVAAAGGSAVTLLHDASYAPGSEGRFRIAAGGYTLELTGGAWGAFSAWAKRHPDVFDGTRTIGAAGARLTAYLDLGELLDEEALAALAKEGVKIVAANFAADAVEVEMSVKGLAVGETAKVEDIAKVFGILGAARCGDQFTPASVVYVEGPQRTPSGGVKYKVAPPAGTRQYFYRGVMRLAD